MNGRQQSTTISKERNVRTRVQRHQVHECPKSGIFFFFICTKTTASRGELYDGGMIAGKGEGKTTKLGKKLGLGILVVQKKNLCMQLRMRKCKRNYDKGASMAENS